MPICADPLFEQPPQRAKLWRYMDFSKFASILATRSLFFARADSFDDTWEGTVSQNDFDAWKATIHSSDATDEEKERLIKNYLQWFVEVRRHTYISCWHWNDGESAAMWKLYLKSGEGIAIQTSFGRLHDELNKAPRSIHLGSVQYADYKTDSIPGGAPERVGNSYLTGPFATFVRKRAGFRHECEVRAVFQDRFDHGYDPSEAEHGIPIEVEVQELVEAVYVAPGTPAWFRGAPVWVRRTPALR